MKTVESPFGAGHWWTVIVVVLVVASGAVSISLVAPSSGGRTAGPIVPAAGSSTQWAFGGIGSASYSCAAPDCSRSGTSSNLSLSYRYYVEWVVIYTVTNVSATQTQVEGQAAVNASLSLSLTNCEVVKTGSPCANSSISLSLSGREVAVGFTNLTTGSVNLTTGVGNVGPSPAWAISNAASNESFNFSGSLSADIPSATGTVSDSATFDLGGSEGAAISFSTPLGVVPLNPQPGYTWGSFAPFTADGQFTSGLSASATVNGTSSTYSKWNHRDVSPSGNVTLSGSDLGAVTLWDNLSAPPTSVTAQEIQIEFGSGNWTGSDGWLMAPSGLYVGAIEGASNATTLVAPARGLEAAVSSSALAAPTGESAYYEKGVGFVGASAAENASLLGTSSSSAGPSIHVNAGPEPVSLAESQYSAILSSGTGSGGSSAGFLTLAVVVVVAVLLVVAVAWRRRRKAMPATPAPSGVPAGPSESSLSSADGTATAPASAPPPGPLP